MHGKCPQGEKPVTRLALDPIDAEMSSGNLRLDALTFSCPFCNTILGAQIDPIVMKTDTIKGLMDEMERRGRIGG